MSLSMKVPNVNWYVVGVLQLEPGWVQLALKKILISTIFAIDISPTKIYHLIPQVLRTVALPFNNDLVMLHPAQSAATQLGMSRRSCERWYVPSPSLQRFTH